jgi:hypothetical protein
MIISFVASTLAEIVCSVWSLMLIPMFYNSVNKPFMYTVECLDYDMYLQTIKYSAVNVFAQTVCFVTMIVFMKTSCNLKVLHVGIQYIKTKKLFWPIICVACLIPFASFTFFMKHSGCDPYFGGAIVLSDMETFGWDEYKEGNSTFYKSQAYIDLYCPAHTLEGYD